MIHQAIIGIHYFDLTILFLCTHFRMRENHHGLCGHAKTSVASLSLKSDYEIVCYVQTLAEDVFIRADYAFSALETILNCLMGYISVLSSSNSNIKILSRFLEIGKIFQELLFLPHSL